ncbi:hypothetical protein CDCA_CDCA16G4211 [Cyanidium caldarium]|uniref:Methyltransferase small domain-containing protein n=1 Tax=Cyanidium caldarium TaxID=2771 RepID=A0AAV9J1A7_CYACA|nr:hypothetical protein CDCA_CDCA16G4211 [Cyanidium caldarium]
MVDAIVPGVQKRSSLSLKQVESVLCSLPRRRFERPRIDLEQYVTSAHVAARVAACAVSRSGEVPERVVDLGTGTGMLAAAVVLHGCPVAVGVDVDVDALRLARENGQHLRRQSVHKPEHSVMDWIQADVVDGVPLSPKTFEVAVMNPPFGTRHRAVDMAFWDVACTLATDAVYTMHKSSTREYVLRRARRAGHDAQVLAEVRFDLPASYRFHRQASADVAVDLWRVRLR